jgi:hypothetical protein
MGGSASEKGNHCFGGYVGWLFAIGEGAKLSSTP